MAAQNIKLRGQEKSAERENGGIKRHRRLHEEGGGDEAAKAAQNIKLNGHKKVRRKETKA